MQIAVWDKSRQKDEDVRRVVKAVDNQIRFHVAPAWRLQPADVIYYPRSQRPPEDAMVIVVDDKTVGGENGRHIETRRGDVRGSAHAGSVKANRVTLSLTISHEIVETFVNPTCNLFAQDDRDTKKVRVYPLEVCDPVQDAAYEIRADGRAVQVSDFVYPAWFDCNAERGAVMDHMRVLERPFRIYAGGELGGVIDITDDQLVTVAGEGYREHRIRLKKDRAARQV
jgi:hypothetical protein